MVQKKLTAEETRLAHEVGLELISALKHKGLSAKLISTQLKRPHSTIPTLASIISEEEGLFIGDRLLRGLTPEIRIAAAKQILAEHVHVSCHVHYWRCWACELATMLIKSIVRDRNLSVRLTAIKAFPRSVKAFGLYRVLFAKDGHLVSGKRKIKKRKWRRGVSPKVREAVIAELAEDGHQKMLLRIALEAPPEFACQVVKILDQANNASVARRADTIVARAAMDQINDPAILKKLFQSRRPAVRTAARKKLGLPLRSSWMNGSDFPSYLTQQ